MFGVHVRSRWTEWQRQRIGWPTQILKRERIRKVGPNATCSPHWCKPLLKPGRGPNLFGIGSTMVNQQ